MNKLVSIIVPVYNCEKFLDRCINSLCDQSYKDYEIILVNDGSKDNSLQKCKNFALKNDKIKVFDKQNGGVSSARNYGLDNANGEYVCFIDADDFVDKDYLTKLISKTKEKTDMIFCGYNIYNNERRTSFFAIEKSMKLLNNDRNIELFYYGKDQLHGSVCRVLFRKAFVGSVRFDEKINYCEDLYFITTLLLKKPKIEVVNEYLYYYCENRGSITRCFRQNYSKKIEEGLKKCSKLLRENGYEKYTPLIEFAIYINGCIDCCLNNGTNKHEIVGLEYRDKYRYKEYLKNSKHFKVKLKAFLCWHKWFKILKFIYKTK